MVRFATRNFIGTKRMGSERKKSSSRSRSTSGKTHVARPSPKRAPRGERRYVICIRNDDYPASLELRKLYVVLEDEFAAEHRMIRVIDESGEDYLYPDSYFLPVDLPAAIERTLRKIA